MTIEECQKLDQPIRQDLELLDYEVRTIVDRIRSESRDAGGDDATFVKASTTVLLSIAAGILARAAEHFIERHGDSRFSDVHASEADSRIRDRAGYWEDEPGQERRLYLFNTSGLQEAAHGFGLARIVTALDTAGALAKRDIEKGRTRNTKKYRLPGGGSPKGLYAIDPERLEMTGTDDDKHTGT